MKRCCDLVGTTKGNAGISQKTRTSEIFASQYRDAQEIT